MGNQYAVFEYIEFEDYADWQQWTTWLCEEDAIHMKKTLSLRFPYHTFFLLKQEG